MRSGRKIRCCAENRNCPTWQRRSWSSARIRTENSTATYARCSLCYEGGRKIQLVINRNHGEELIAEVDNVKETPVYLKVVVEKLTRTFYYSYDGQKWEKVGALENCIYLCDEGVPDDPKRHTGTLVGIYANNGGCGSRKAADFDYFKYED